MMKTVRNYRKIRCPEYADSRYIILDNEIFVNINADPNTTYIARIVPSLGSGVRGR